MYACQTSLNTFLNTDNILLLLHWARQLATPEGNKACRKKN